MKTKLMSVLLAVSPMFMSGCVTPIPIGGGYEWVCDPAPLMNVVGNACQQGFGGGFNPGFVGGGFNQDSGGGCQPGFGGGINPGFGGGWGGGFQGQQIVGPFTSSSGHNGFVYDGRPLPDLRNIGTRPMRYEYHQMPDRGGFW